MKNLKYFIDLENKMGVKGKGDKLEASLINIKRHELFINGKQVKIDPAPGLIYDESILSLPVFCLTIKNYREICIKDKFPEFEYRIDFDSKFLDDFQDGELPYLLVIHNIVEFTDRFEKALAKQGIGGHRNIIIYRDKSNFNIDPQSNLLKLDTPFTKDISFEYQKEYRFIIFKPVDDFFEVEIGNIEDISTLVNIRDGGLTFYFKEKLYT